MLFCVHIFVEDPLDFTLFDFSDSIFHFRDNQRLIFFVIEEAMRLVLVHFENGCPWDLRRSMDVATDSLYLDVGVRKLERDIFWPSVLFVEDTAGLPKGERGVQIF